MLETVTFDVWNTLLVHDFNDDRLTNARIARVGNALESAGFRISPECLREAYEYTEERLSLLWKQEKDIGLDGHVALFLDGLGLEPDEMTMAIIREPYALALLDFRPSVVDGARDALESLKNKGYRIGLISNTGRTPGTTIRTVLEGYGLLSYFDWTAFSNEVGYIKPNLRIFERALAGLGSAPGSAVHIGDSMLLDIYGARRAGMKSILFNKYSERFEKYATRYYDANGRHENPDETVGDLADVAAAVERLDRAGKVNI
jgi:putative hydrolase of the HAD superfamily